MQTRYQASWRLQPVCAQGTWSIQLQILHPRFPSQLSVYAQHPSRFASLFSFTFCSILPALAAPLSPALNLSRLARWPPNALTLATMMKSAGEAPRLAGPHSTVLLSAARR